MADFKKEGEYFPYLRRHTTLFIYDHVLCTEIIKLTACLRLFGVDLIEEEKKMHG